MSQASAPPPVSPDGRFWWDGGQWQPMPSTAAPLPPQITPQVSAPVVVAVEKDTTEAAWIVALTPLAMVLGLLVGLGGLAVLVAVVVAAICAHVDVKALKSSGGPGKDMDGSYGISVLLLYVIAAPLYLLARTKKVGSYSAIPAVWFGSMLLVLVLAFA